MHKLSRASISRIDSDVRAALLALEDELTRKGCCFVASTVKDTSITLVHVGKN